MNLLASSPSPLSPGRQLHRVGRLCGLALLLFRAVTTQAATVTNVAAGYGHSLFVKSGGSLWAMGANDVGQLGDGTTTNHLSPEQIVSSNVTAIAGGQYHSLFVKSDGSLWAMGYNYYGQLGDGTTTNHLSPEQIVASNVTAIAAGGFHSLFVKSGGGLWAMGANDVGQLGDGTTTNHLSPEHIVPSNVTAIAAGADYSLFVKSDGSLWAMGDDYYGQLGDGIARATNDIYCATPEQIGLNSWINPASDKWETAANWSLAVAPSSSDAADLITNAGNKTVTIDSATATNAGGIHMTINNLTVSAPSGSTNTLVLSSTGTLSTPFLIKGAVTLGGGGGITVTNSALEVDTTGGGLAGVDAVLVGVAGSGNTLAVTNGGALYDNNGLLGNNSTSSGNSVLVAGAGSVWSNQNYLFVGNSGAGNQLTITNGGHVVSGSGYLGEGASSSNNVALVIGSGSVWSNQFSLYVGFGGAGNQLTIANGGQAVSSNGYVGDLPSSSNNVVLVTGSGSVWSNSFELYVGEMGPSNLLTIANGGHVVNSYGFLGDFTSSSNNVVLVTGAGSIWSNRNALYVGNYGAGNQLTIANGGQVVDGNGELGVWASSSNNVALVTGSGSVWSNSSYLWVGLNGAGNQLTITNGGQVVGSGSVGVDSSASNNVVLVTGPGSVWTNNGFAVGQYGGGNQLTIANGGQVVSTGGFPGNYTGVLSYYGSASNNVVLVTGSGSVWNNQGNLAVGYSGVGNLLTVTNGGAVFADNLALGAYAGSSGTLTVAGGTVSVTELIATNAGSAVVFNSGVINSAGAAITNGLTFADGDGTDAATYHMLGGVHSFANGFEIRNNASLTGCGTITGNVVVDSGGTLLADCGGTLSFTGTVTNNGTITAVAGTTIKFSVLMVNNGTIVATNGGVNFLGGVVNNGTMMLPPNSWIDGSAKWETATNWWLGTGPSSSDAVDLITNAGNNTVTIDGTTAGSYPGTMTIRNLTVSAPGVATNTLFLNNAGTNTPLRVWGGLMLGTNGAMVVNNSAVLATNSVNVGISSPSSSLIVSNGGSLIVTNSSSTARVVVNGGSLILGTGTFKTDNLVVTNGGVVQHTQTYQVDNATVTVAGGSEQAGSNLVAGSSANATGIVTVTDGGQLVVTNGVLGLGNNGTLGGGSGVGQMTVSNGTLLASTILLGSSAGGQGDLLLANGGTISCPAGTNGLIAINSLGADQIGGDLAWDGSTLECGVSAPGDYTVSGGQASFEDLYAGYSNVGTLTMAGGVANISSRLIVGQFGSPAVATGSVWVTSGQMTMTNGYSIIGNSGVGQMTISNGTVTAADVFVGLSSNPGTLTLAGGTLAVNGIVLPNPSSQFIFSGGCLNTKAITNANGQTCVVGNGATPATLTLLGGISSFGNGLKISANATALGSGTINGVVVNAGTILADATTLVFNNAITNNGVIIARNGGLLNFFGPVINGGLIDVSGGGGVQFNSTFTNINNGVLRLPVTTINLVGANAVIGIRSAVGCTYQLQGCNSLTAGSWVNIGSAATGNGGLLPLTDFGGATNTPSRFYRIQVGP